MEIKYQKLTPEEIQELNVHKCQRIMAENVNVLADIGNELFIWSGKLAEAKIKVDQLKHTKDVIVEINRALAKVIQYG
jgi:hypothetical protein